MPAHVKLMHFQGDLHQYLKEKGALSPLTAVNFALDIARYTHLMFSMYSLRIYVDVGRAILHILSVDAGRATGLAPSTSTNKIRKGVVIGNVEK
jgi:hypothetical protein